MQPILDWPVHTPGVLWRVDSELLAPTDEDPVDEPIGRMQKIRANTKHMLYSAKHSKIARWTHDKKKSISRKTKQVYSAVTGRPNKLNDQAGTKTQLGDKEKRQLSKLPTEPFHQVVKKVGRTPLTPEAQQATRKRNEEQDGKSVWKFVKTSMIDMISDLVSSNERAKFMGILKGAATVVEQFAKDCTKLVKYIKKENGDKDSKLGFKDYVKLAGDHAKTVGDIMGPITESIKDTIGKTASSGAKKVIGRLETASDGLNFVGSLVTAMIKFPRDCKSAHRNTKNIDRMRKQKESAKRMIYEGQKEVNGPKYVKKTRDNELEFDHHHSDFKENRIDQRIKQLETSVEGRGRGMYLEGLREYAMTKELTGANQKRRRETIYQILVDELGGILSSATTLFGLPEVGGVLSVIFSTVGGVKTLMSYAKKGLRNIKFKYADSLKSGDNKWQKRHELAIWTYQNISMLRNHEITMTHIAPTTTDPMEVRAVQAYLPVRQIQKDRVKAMGVDMEDLSGAHDAKQILDILRSGFYQDVEEHQKQTQ